MDVPSRLAGSLPCGIAPGAPGDITAKRQEIIGHLKAFAVWEELPLRELQAECQDRSVSVATQLGHHCSHAEKEEEIVDRLLISCCANEYERRGVPAWQLGSPTAAFRLSEQFEALSSLGIPDLSDECRKLGIPRGLVNDRLVLVSRLRTAFTWLELRQEEFRNECQKLGVQIAGKDRHDLVHQLAEAVWAPAQQQTQSEQQRDDRSAPTIDRWHNPQAIVQHFETLELPTTATVADVKRAYKELALRYHPDKNPGDPSSEASHRFRQVAEAYRALCPCR